MKISVFVGLTLFLTVFIAACSEDQKPVAKEPNWDKLIAKKFVEKPDEPGALTVTSHGGVSVTLSPQNPVSGACMKAAVKGTPSRSVYLWEVNGINVQMGESGGYCLEDARRGDVVTVTVGDERAGGNASVTVVNTSPKIVDTKFQQVDEGENSFIEVVPQIEDPDEDLMTIEYQWLLNGEPLEDQLTSRLPSTVFKKGDEVKVKIVADDGFSRSKEYETRNLNLPGGPPVITSRPPTTFRATEYTYQVKASDPDGDPVIFSLDEAPEGMTINAETGDISWPLKEVEAGTYRIRIMAADSDGGNAFQEFSLTLAKK